MLITPLGIEGAWRVDPVQHADERGVFLEWFKGAPFATEVGHDLDLRQANMSVSAAGVIRGVHYADVPPSQAKYVTCPSGAVLDVVVDIRVGSPTFGQWESVLLDDASRSAVYVSEGLGHAFMALTDRATVVYLCSEAYNPAGEHGLNPLDPDLAIAWPTTSPDGESLTPQLSPKDAAAPTLAQALEMGVLPSHADAVAFRAGF